MFQLRITRNTEDNFKEMLIIFHYIFINITINNIVRLNIQLYKEPEYVETWEFSEKLYHFLKINIVLFKNISCRDILECNEVFCSIIRPFGIFIITYLSFWDSKQKKSTYLTKIEVIQMLKVKQKPSIISERRQKLYRLFNNIKFIW